MKVKMSGMKPNSFCCTGSAGGGFKFVCSHIVIPMMIGNTPSTRNGPKKGRCEGSHGMSPNRLNRFVGSGADKSLTQAKKGAWRMSMVTSSTLYSEKKTGTWISIGRQPAKGFTFSF